jgi:hypothetical protein
MLTSNFSVSKFIFVLLKTGKRIKMGLTEGDTARPSLSLPVELKLTAAVHGPKTLRARLPPIFYR